MAYWKVKNPPVSQEIGRKMLLNSVPYGLHFLKSGILNIPLGWTWANDDVYSKPYTPANLRKFWKIARVR